MLAPTRLDLAARTQGGEGREVDQGSFLVVDLATRAEVARSPAPFARAVESTGALLLAVAGGIGGPGAGDVAGRLVLETMAASLSAPPGETSWSGRLAAATDAAARVVLDLAARDRRMVGAGAAAVAAVIEGDRLDVANVGETLAFVWRGRRLVRITPTFSRPSGPSPWFDDPDEQAAWAAQMDAYLHSRAFGMVASMKPSLITVALRAGDAVLLTSGPFTSLARHEEIEEAMLGAADARAACEAIAGMAAAAGLPDGVTVLVARPEGPALRPPSGEDALSPAPHTVL